VTLAASLETLRDEAITEADAAFTPERLAAQRAHILRRLENADRPARVLPFPLAHRTTPVRQPTARRWIAAAAAAGLFVGAIAGKFIDPWAVGRGAGRPQVVSQGQPALSALPDWSEEDFLLDVELALERPVIDGLETIDAMTPVVQTVAMEIQ
jgi:hypothetical protein